MPPKSTLPEIQHFLPCDPDCRKQKFCKKIWEKVPPKIRSFFYISPVELPLLFIISFCLLSTNHPVEKIGITLRSLIQFILEAIYIHFFFRAISTKPKYISNSYTDFNHNNSIEQYLEIKFTDFKTWLQEYLTSNNSPLDYSAHIKKNPIEILISIFKPQKKDFKFIWAILTVLTIHLSLYYFNLIYFVDVLRIILTATVVVYVTKNIYSAYINSSLIVDSFKSHPLQFFTSIIALGGLSALTIPATMNIFKLIGDSTALTTAMLGITGGIIAVFGLIKSHQKSELEREQLEVQKQKDSREHIRQLHNSYSDRFDKAVTELNSGDSKDAFAAVYKLVHLADDWLEYKDLSDNEKEQNKLKNRAQKETQTIIDILCKYIRTMPKTCTDKDLQNIKTIQGKKKNLIEKEAEVRQLIFSEIKTRTDYLKRINIPNDINAPLPGEKEPPEDSWGRYTFNFFGAPIFYSLDGMHFPNSDFSEANFYEGSSFCSTKFQKAKFVNATFFEDIKFNNAKFLGQTLFTESIFKKRVSFYSVNFLGELRSSKIDVYGIADYSAARFYDLTIFHSSEFHKDLKGHSGSHINWQNQDYTLFKAVHTAPRKTIEWHDTKFYGYVDFYSSVFNNDALFRDVEFMEGCNFLRSTFETADFKNSKFTGKAGFQEVTFTHRAYYRHVNSPFQKDSFRGAEYIYGFNHEFPGFACLGTIPKDRNFDVGSYLYPLGSRFYKISKNGNKIYSQYAQQI